MLTAYQFWYILHCKIYYKSMIYFNLLTNQVIKPQFFIQPHHLYKKCWHLMRHQLDLAFYQRSATIVIVRYKFGIIFVKYIPHCQTNVHFFPCYIPWALFEQGSCVYWRHTPRFVLLSVNNPPLAFSWRASVWIPTLKGPVQSTKIENYYMYATFDCHKLLYVAYVESWL